MPRNVRYGDGPVTLDAAGCPNVGDVATHSIRISHSGRENRAPVARPLVKLPSAKSAIVDPSKLRDYLLSTTHPVGYTKARFFGRLGFDTPRWKDLQAQLLALALNAEAEPVELTRFGQKYQIRGIIRGPNGRVGAVLTIWIIRDGEIPPRLVTAIPVAST